MEIKNAWIRSECEIQIQKKFLSLRFSQFLKSIVLLRSQGQFNDYEEAVRTCSLGYLKCKTRDFYFYVELCFRVDNDFRLETFTIAPVNTLSLTSSTSLSFFPPLLFCFNVHVPSGLVMMKRIYLMPCNTFRFECQGNYSNYANNKGNFSHVLFLFLNEKLSLARPYVSLLQLSSLLPQRAFFPFRFLTGFFLSL